MWSSYLSKILHISFLFVLFQLKILGTPFPQAWNVPSENPNFVGREDILNEISNLFITAASKTVIISGTQGFGKSQVAKRFVYQNYANYDVVWWFRANQYIKPQFEEFALVMAPILGMDIPLSIQAIGHEHLITIIKEGIRRKNLKCLLVFDDAHAYSEIESYIPFSHDKNTHTIVTTKNGNFSTQPIQIKPFKRADSLQYVNLFLSQEPEKSKDELAERFGDCPAALAVSIDYIKSYPGMTIEQYLNKHKTQKIFLPSPNAVSQKFGSSVDGYNKDLLVAIQMNMEELRQRSEEAFQFLSLLSLLHRDEIPIKLIEKWIKSKGINENIDILISLVNQYSLIDINNTKNKKGDFINMQELIQEIIVSQISVEEKINRIDEAAKILKESFTGTSEEVVKTILKDTTPLLHAIKLSKEADDLGHHTSELASLRIVALNILVGYIRDFDNGKRLVEQLKKDIKHKIKISKQDNILYNTNLFIIHAVSSDFESATKVGDVILKLLASEKKMYEEKIRFFSNLIQYCSLIGTIDNASKFVETGEKLLPLSKAPEHNCLYIYATSMHLIDRGEIDKAIALIRKYQGLLDEQASYHPSMRFFTLNLLAEALLKKGDIEEAKHILSLAEKQGKEFYGNDDQNNFCGKLYVLKASCQSEDPHYFETAKSLIERAIQIFKKIYQGPDKHRNQAFTYLYLGRLFHQHKQLEQAKLHYLESEAIFTKVLKNQKIDDVSILYTQLALLGIDMKDETLTNVYLKKQIETFGLNHFRTREIIRYLDERDLPLPM